MKAVTAPLIVVCGFLILVPVLSSSPPEGETKPSRLDTLKNATSSDNRLTDAPPTPRPTPAPENCSDGSTLTPRECPSDVQCKDLRRECLQCNFNCTCVYGHSLNVTCRHRDDVTCQGKDEFLVEMVCQYCFQTEPWQHTCLGSDKCVAVSSPRDTFTSNCTVKSDVLCLGNRVFRKKLPCNWTSGYKWSSALILSILFGGFGADRFYLGHWQEGIGKLFSFGGLGVWTIIDVILIAIRYIGPADGSLYI